MCCLSVVLCLHFLLYYMLFACFIVIFMDNCKGRFFLPFCSSQSFAFLLHFVYLLANKSDLIVGPIPWGHSGPLCHALSLSSSWTSMRRRRATVAAVATLGEWQCKMARSSEWAQHFSNASCLICNWLIFFHKIKPISMNYLNISTKEAGANWIEKCVGNSWP